MEEVAELVVTGAPMQVSEVGEPWSNACLTLQRRRAVLAVHHVHKGSAGKTILVDFDAPTTPRRDRCVGGGPYPTLVPGRPVRLWLRRVADEPPVYQFVNHAGVLAPDVADEKIAAAKAPRPQLLGEVVSAGEGGCPEDQISVLVLLKPRFRGRVLPEGLQGYVMPSRDIGFAGNRGGRVQLRVTSGSGNLIPGCVEHPTERGDQVRVKLPAPEWLPLKAPH